MLTTSAILAAIAFQQKASVEPSTAVATYSTDTLADVNEFAKVDLGDQLTPVSSNARPVYKYSVVPGGAHSPVEMRTAINTDPVVATHYKTLNASGLRTEVVREDRLVHVSYRKGDEVFWTKKKVLLRKGETILTDGTTQIRTRCGNCIADEPLGPTTDAEPDLVELDRLVDSAPVSAPPAAGISAMNAPVAGGVSDPFSGAGAAGGRSPMAFWAPGAAGGSGGGGIPQNTASPAGVREPNPNPSNESDPPGVYFPNAPPLDFAPDGDDPKPPTDDLFPPGNPYTPEPDLPPGGNDPVNPVPVPEPGTLLLVGGGVAALARRAYRKRNQR